MEADLMPGNDASAQLAEMGRRLRMAADGKQLRLELIRSLRASASKPLIPAVQAAALEKLPHEGGLNKQVASQKVTVRVALAGRNTGVRLTTSAPDTAQTDAGWVRHPVFDRSGASQMRAAKQAGPTRQRRWVTQQIPQAVGWWSQTLSDKSPEVTPLVVAAMEKVLTQIRLVDRIKFRFKG